MLKGNKINLRPMRSEEIPMFYKWATESDATPFWYGELYGNKIPSYEEFLEDWKPCFFTDDEPKKGRCFVILLGEKPIGQINYNEIINGRVEIDILIADKENWGKGYGPDAMKTLVKFLNVKEVWIVAIKKNKAAIKAYQKAGFEIGNFPEDVKKQKYWADKNLDEWVFLSCRK